MSYGPVIVLGVFVAIAAYVLSRTLNDTDSGPLFAPDMDPATQRAIDKDKTTAPVGAGVNPTSAAWRANVIESAIAMQIAFDALTSAAPSYALPAAVAKVNTIVSLAETGTKARLGGETRGNNPVSTLSRGAQAQSIAFDAAWKNLQAAIAAPDR